MAGSPWGTAARSPTGCSSCAMRARQDKRRLERARMERLATMEELDVEGRLVRRKRRGRDLGNMAMLRKLMDQVVPTPGFVLRKAMEEVWMLEEMVKSIRMWITPEAEGSRAQVAPEDALDRSENCG